MKNYTKVSFENKPRVELHDQLKLTGTEISINTISAGECVPFIHSHKQNEEVYYILSGTGKVIIDDEEISLIAGDWIRISPSANRQFFASKNDLISYICIQAKENSLEQFTANDTVIK
ncbi:MAG: cupin domain-containing protein [Beduini sp.]